MQLIGSSHMLHNILEPQTLIVEFSASTYFYKPSYAPANTEHVDMV